MMRFVIDGQKLRLLGNPYIVGNSHDYLTASFQFFSDPDWEATEKHVFFKLGTNNPYEIILVDDTISKDKHLNLSDGIWSIYIIGYDINDGTLVERIPTNKVSLLVEESGIEEGEPFPDVGGSTGEQILASEQDRIDQELTRVAAEGVRVASEQGRVTEEQNRVVAEQGRDTAEGLRVTAESGRDSAEGLRDTAEQGRDTAEDSRVIAESARAFYAEYNAATSYILGNKVSYNGSSYIWTDDDSSVAGTQPPNTGWLLISSRGDDGTSGVYVGSDPIPEGYNVQIDPDGDATDVVLQFGTMPTADAGYLGVTVLYTGATGTYKNGGTYICVASEDVTPVYSWSRVGEDVSGAISTHNTDAGAHANLQILDAGGYYDATTVEGALQEVGDGLEQITKRRIYGFDEYGFFQKPADFTPTLPCLFWRNSGGEVKHNMSFDQFKGGTKIYVTLAGNDSAGNGSVGTPYKTLKKAFEVARLGADASYEILTDRAMFDRDEADFVATYVGKNIAVISTSATKSIISSNATYAWTADGTGTYKTTRSGVVGIIDNLNRDINGLPVPLLSVASVAACQATAGTWYTDDATAWVHRTDGVLPTHANTIVSLAVTALEPVLSGSTMYFENFIFCGWDVTTGNALKIRAGANSLNEKVCFYNCGFVSSNPKIGNGLAAVNIKDVYLFECISAYGQQDGFNYHYDGITTFNNRRTCLVLEYNCLAYHLGIEYPNAASNNASSAHEGVNIIRFGTIGYYNTGATIIDVNGCYSILIDCEASNHVINGVSGAGTAYSFSSEGAGSGLGKTYMINCKASSCANALTISTTHTGFTYGLDYVGTIVNNGTLIQQ